jgi:hypothetical protein
MDAPMEVGDQTVSETVASIKNINAIQKTCLVCQDDDGEFVIVPGCAHRVHRACFGDTATLVTERELKAMYCPVPNCTNTTIELTTTALDLVNNLKPSRLVSAEVVEENYDKIVEYIAASPTLTVIKRVRETLADAAPYPVFSDEFEEKVTKINKSLEASIKVHTNNVLQSIKNTRDAIGARPFEKDQITGIRSNTVKLNRAIGLLEQLMVEAAVNKQEKERLAEQLKESSDSEQVDSINLMIEEKTNRDKIITTQTMELSVAYLDDAVMVDVQKFLKAAHAYKDTPHSFRLPVHYWSLPAATPRLYNMMPLTVFKDQCKLKANLELPAKVSIPTYTDNVWLHLISVGKNSWYLLGTTVHARFEFNPEQDSQISHFAHGYTGARYSVAPTDKPVTRSSKKPKPSPQTDVPKLLPVAPDQRTQTIKAPKVSLSTLCSVATTDEKSYPQRFFAFNSETSEMATNNVLLPEKVLGNLTITKLVCNTAKTVERISFLSGSAVDMTYWAVFTGVQSTGLSNALYIHTNRPLSHSLSPFHEVPVMVHGANDYARLNINELPNAMVIVLTSGWVVVREYIQNSLLYNFNSGVMNSPRLYVHDKLIYVYELTGKVSDASQGTHIRVFNLMGETLADWNIEIAVDTLLRVDDKLIVMKRPESLEQNLYVYDVTL